LPGDPISSGERRNKCASSKVVMADQGAFVMNGIIYLVGLVVVVLFILSVLGLR
jgi:hypothetical protein